MVKATDIQVGTTGHRIYREPMDAETVLYSYDNLRDKITMIDQCNTLNGFIYPGMFAGVVNDTEEIYNGPYYISYNINNNNGEEYISYTSNKLVTEYDVNSIFFDWGTLD